MAPVKVASTGKARPRIIRVESAKRQPPVTYEPDLVRVRATARGYYAVREVMKDPRTGKSAVVRNDIIRNPGEVFEMDTADMRQLVDGQLAEIPMGAIGNDDGKRHVREFPHASEFGVIEIETERGQFELPSWVTMADESGVEVDEPTGHKTTFGKKDNEVL